ncbi:tRNA (34-2'-O)-methyltransferase regulator WDR6-like [Amphiura filiformis]|uniref:tRNA (34-2'-O)-methyltransferase regulator WDR6-like n=1 Tax=Amphiura filiformis TaxID=82378 RepID=UPI003B21FC08
MASDPVIETNSVTVPITSLTFYGEYLLSGEGPFLKVYQVTHGKLICQKDVLNLAVIHGICKGFGSHFVIYGQKSLCVVSIQISQHDCVQICLESTVCELKDLIWNICWLQENSTIEQHWSQLAVILAHNSVVRWHWKERLVLQHAHCAENCILYSALLIGNTWDTLFVAAGTVFNQIVVWKPSTEQESTQRCAVQKRYTGHQEKCQDSFAQQSSPANKTSYYKLNKHVKWTVKQCKRKLVEVAEMEEAHAKNKTMNSSKELEIRATPFGAKLLGNT